MDQRERIRSWVQHYERPLCQYAARITGDPDRARDVVQDTFLRLCRKGGKLDKRSVAPWLYRVCRNRALDVVRKEKRMRTLTEDAEARLAARGADPAVTAQRRESLSRILQAVRQLPGAQEEAIRLKFQHEMSYRQIAQLMHTTENYVGQLIHMGVKTLRARLAAGKEI